MTHLLKPYILTIAKWGLIVAAVLAACAKLKQAGRIEERAKATEKELRHVKESAALDKAIRQTLRNTSTDDKRKWLQERWK